MRNAASSKVSSEVPPESCLALLHHLRLLEMEFFQKIRWPADWPPVTSRGGGFRLPVALYDGPTQSKEESLQIERQTCQEELVKHSRLLPTMFDARGLPAPTSHDLDTGSTDSARSIWPPLAAQVQKAAFGRNELPRSWAPQVTDWHFASDPPANRKLYPQYPIRKSKELERWRRHWCDRCALPECPTHARPRSGEPQTAPIVIMVPKERPPFRPAVECVRRCTEDDMTRELRNCRRSLNEWGFTEFPKMGGRSIGLGCG